MRGLRKILAALALVVGLGVVATPAMAAPVHSPGASGVVVAGDVNDFTFDSVHIDYTLTPGADGAGHLKVVETYVANFTQADTHRGMQRVLPTTFGGRPLNPHLISITDENGQARPQESDSDDGNYLMTSRNDDPVMGKQTYVFTYTVDNVARYYSDRDVDEFYWDVVGAEWAQPFGDVTMTLTVDPSLADGLTGRMACSSGASNAQGGSCTMYRDGNVITMDVGALDRYEGVTIAVGFDAGTFTPFDTSYFASPAAPVHLGLVGVAGVGLIGAFAGRAIALRDAKGRGLVIPQYEPPPGFDAMDTAVMMRRTARAVPAEILEQAVRGSVQLREKSAGEFEVVLVDRSRSGDDNGARTINALFGNAEPGKAVNLAKNRKVGTRLGKLVAKQINMQKSVGLRRAPSTFWGKVYPVLMWIIAIAALIIGFLISSARNNGWGFAVGALAAIMAFAVGFVLNKKPLTQRGAELRDDLDGLKMFMEWAEADRIRMLQSPETAERVRVNPSDPASMLKLYEPLLPFAVVFGLEKQWTKNLQFYYDTGGFTPYWYYGSTPFSSSSFSSLSSSLSSYTPASSSSSSSSGSFGGVSVGGGGGGGGGGGV